MLARVRERRADAALVMAVAAVVRLAVVAWASARFPAVEDGHYYDVLARRLAGGSGYTWLWPDGAVTYAAHYPVGYPAMLAVAYAVLGPSLAAAMTLNALVGAVAAYGAHRIVDAPGVARWRPVAGGLAVALHPALVPYAAALMTEGVAAALVVAAFAAAGGARGPGRAWPWVLGAGLMAGLATLVRPQSLLIAPVLGALAAGPEVRWRSRGRRAAAVTAIALGCVMPWTARNCVHMHRCALVSVNGGWNLLIGAATTSGGWEPLATPSACATEWDEARKDSCFERVARVAILQAPASWIARAPAKLGATLDYFGAAPWYLHVSDPDAFGDRAKVVLGTIETATSRLLLLGALFVAGRMDGRRANARKVVAALGAVAAVSVYGWIGYAALAACLVLAGWRTAARAPMVVPATAAVILATMGVHATFFGAGRYGLAVVPFVAALAFAEGSGLGREGMASRTGLSYVVARDHDDSGGGLASERGDLRS
jgi:4-amino-4-deoxy-L-arabinose transferase-like glycosyltransferase